MPDSGSPEQDSRQHLESVPSAEGLDRMAAALGQGHVAVIRRLGGGLACATHLVDLGGERLVLKRGFPDADLETEFENLGFAMRSLTPTPEPVACDQEGLWFGTPAIVMTALPGAHNLFPRDADEWIRGLAGALAAIHDTPSEDLPPRRPPRPLRWERWSPDPDPLLDAVARAVAELVGLSTADPACLAHDDYHPGNTLFDGDRLTGVVDWAQVTREPRGSAVAYCRKDLALHPGGDAPERFLAAYEAEIGHRVEHLDLWDILQGARAVQWGHRWPPAFAEVGIDIRADEIEQVSRRFLQAALRRRSAT